MKKAKQISTLLTFYLFPLLVEACPLCVNASPFKKSMLLAVFVLLPVPFALVGGLVLWIRKAAKEEAEATESNPL